MMAAERMEDPLLRYRSDAELDPVFDAIEDIRATLAWRRWQKHTSLVT